MTDSDWKKWARDYWLWLVVYALIFLYFLTEFASGSELSWSHFKSSLGLPLTMLVATVFVQVFTTPIQLPLPKEATAEQKEENRKTLSLQRRNWMILAYGFMLVSLLVPIYIFSWGWERATASATANELMDVKHPIAVFLGCAKDDGKNELSCFPSSQQSKQQSTQQSKQQQETSSQATTANQPQNAAVAEPAAIPERSAWVLNVGGHVRNADDTKCKLNSKTNAVCQVSGGLLVPLYVIIIALMGGSISLTRRLPEYQKRANPEYVPTAKEPKLSQHEFREYLAFQIIQFISAPLIAIVAYYLIEPETTPIAVVMAFTAGFASETILLMVRAAAEKVTPVSAEPKTGTITGVVVFKDTSGKLQPIEGAEVALSTSSHIRTITDELGCYVLSSISIGEHGIKVKAMCNNVERQTTGSVKIASAQEIVKQNWILEINP
jgi:hypothetical protein